MISAIGVSYLLQNLALYVTGGLNKNYPTIPWISDTVSVFGATTKMVTLVTPVLTLVLVVLLVLLINHTKIGMAMRAVAKDFETSTLMGIKINNVISMTFIIGSFLAAIGSMLFFTNYPRRHAHLRRHAGPEGLRRGGVRRHRLHPGAVIGAFIIGICENIIKGLDTILAYGVIPTGWGLDLLRTRSPSSCSSSSSSSSPPACSAKRPRTRSEEAKPWI